MCVKRGGTKENTCSLSFINISICVWFAHIQYNVHVLYNTVY